MANVIMKKKDRTRDLFKKPGDQTGEMDITDTPESAESTNDSDRIRLSCDITRVQHRRLRMEAARTDRTILQVIENMIETHLGA